MPIGPDALRCRNLPKGYIPKAPVASATGFFIYTRSMCQKTRVMAFIDGYNFYHSVLEMIRLHPKQRHDLKWVNLWDLVRAFTTPSTEDLVAVHYFSAYANWIPDAAARHRVFVKALKHVGVTVTMGEFKKRDRQCRNCGKQWVEHDEKASDVNLALTMLQQANLNAFDRAIILTADTDLVPAVKMVREQFPALRIHAMLPRTRYVVAHAMRSVCHLTHKYDESHLQRNLFPEELVLADGTTIKRPEKYAPIACQGPGKP